MPVDTSHRNAGPRPHRPTVELLQALIRNECVNDGTPDSGGEIRNADLLETYLAGAGLDIERFESRPGPGLDRRPHRGLRPRRPDAVPDGPHRRRAGQSRRLVARPVRRRADRRRGVGAGRDRHAQPHLVDGRRVPAPRDHRLQAEGHADLLRRRRRGGRRAVRRRMDVRAPPATRSAATTCSPSSAAGRRSVTTAPAASRSTSARRGSPGAACASPARPATARCRSVRTTRWSRRPRSCAACRRTGPAAQISDIWRGQVAAMSLPDEVRAGLIDPDRLWATLETTADVGGPDVPRHDAHDDLAERRPRRPEDERHPRRHRPRGRHPHRARHDPRGRRGDARTTRSATSPPTSRWPSCRTRRPPSRRIGNPLWDADRGPHAGRVPGCRADPRADRRRYRRPVLPRARARSPTAPGCSRRR